MKRSVHIVGDDTNQYSDENTDIKNVQRGVLDIYKEIKALCDTHSIRYYAIAGTAIGTVRHVGFIPWDDDIDIVMPRKDYERFITLAKLLPSHLAFSDQSTDNFSTYIFGKVSNKYTTYVSSQELDNPSAYNGLFVDIMPLDGAPTSKIRFHIHMKLLEAIMRMSSAIVYSLGKHEKGGLKSTLKTCVGKFLSLFFSNHHLKKLYIRTASRYAFDDSSYLARTWLVGSHDGLRAKARYHQEDFAGYIDMPFEDTTMRMPQGYDRYLSALYPNYMTPPPKEKQVPRHSGGIVDLEHSYKYHIAKREGKIIGYVPGSFDMFHVGHLNIIQKAKQYCDYLIVGVNSDNLMHENKGKYPIVPEAERIDIISSIGLVDEAVLIDTADKMKLHDRHKFDILFVGSDYKGKWDTLEKKLAKEGARIHYFDYTAHTSSTKLRSALDDRIVTKKRRK